MLYIWIVPVNPSVISERSKLYDTDLMDKYKQLKVGIDLHYSLLFKKKILSVVLINVE